MRHAFKQVPGFQQDLYDLPEPVRRAAATVLMDVVEGTRRGQLLESRSATADLSDCRKVYFDSDPRAKPRYRLVYMETADGITGLCIVAVAVGRRAALDAYGRAAKNLGR